MAKKPSYEELEQRVRELEKDVVKHELAEEKMLESEISYRDLMAGIPIGISISSPEGNVLDANSAVLKMTGYDSKKDFFKIPASDHYYAEKDRERFVELHEKGLAKDFEARFIRKDGTVFWGSITSLARTTATETTIYINVIQDISERRQAEEKIAHLSRVLYSIRSVNQLITKEIDKNRLIRGACDNLVANHGYFNTWIAIFDKSRELMMTAEAGLGKDFSSMVERLKHGELTACGIRALAQSEVVITKDPLQSCHDCPLSSMYRDRGALTVRLEYGGNLYGILSASIPANLTEELEEQSLFKEVAGDIAYALYNIELAEEHKQGEKELKEARNYLEKLFSYANAPIIVWDPGLTITRFNHAFERLTGYASGEVIGQKLDMIFPEPSREESLRKILHTLSEKSWELEEISILCKDGGVRTILWNSANVYSEDESTVVATIAQGQDITIRKRGEKERERLLNELADKNRELEQIVYVVSHDLRSPLLNIQGFTKELDYSLKEISSILHDTEVSSSEKARLAPVLEKDIPDSFRYILLSTSKMDSMLSALLRFSRLGRGALAIEKLDMNRLISDIAKTFKFQIKENGVRLEVGKLPPCRGDKTQINQVFSNIMGNALKFLDPNRPGIIRISGREDRGRAEYCIEDNGIGIDPAFSKKVFELFHRLNPQTGVGDGLGLTIVSKILDRHGGKIKVESEPGKGAKFFISLL